MFPMHHIISFKRETGKIEAKRANTLLVVYSCSPKLHWSHRIYQSVFCTSLSSKHVRPLEALIRTTGTNQKISPNWLAMES